MNTTTQKPKDISIDNINKGYMMNPLEPGIWEYEHYFVTLTFKLGAKLQKYPIWIQMLESLKRLKRGTGKDVTIKAIAPELTQLGKLHWHYIISFDTGMAEQRHKLFLNRWITNCGMVHIKPIKATHDDQNRCLDYCLKGTADLWWLLMPKHINVVQKAIVGEILNMVPFTSTKSVWLLIEYLNEFYKEYQRDQLKKETKRIQTLKGTIFQYICKPPILTRQ